MTTTPNTGPTPDEVGRFYDTMNHLIARFQGGSIHYGYWTGPDDGSSFEEASQRLTDVVVDRLKVGPGDRVLDLGCGTGQPAVRMAQTTGAHVLGVSISRGDVELATALAARTGLSTRVTFRQGDALDLPFPDDSFDAVLAIELLVHVPDRPRVLREIARVLRPGGRLALTDFTLKGEIGDPETERHLADALAAFAAMPLAPLAEYPGYLEQAGLTLDELVDITDNTAGYSYQHMLVAMRKYMDEHDDVPPELTRMFAALSAPQDQAGEPDPQPDADAQPEPQPERIILVSAHLP